MTFYMSKRNPSLLIEDILESANKIILFTEDMSFEDFESDIKTIDAVIRNFEVIGEASNRLPESFKELNENIDWQKIIGFRNKLIHDYVKVNNGIVWEIRNDYLPILITELEKIK
jgi:uncharacterized protein with HEPN domain